MSEPTKGFREEKMNDELIQQITTLLAKHEVHNEVLAVELALLVRKREKTQIKRAHRTTKDILKNV